MCDLSITIFTTNLQVSSCKTQLLHIPLMIKSLMICHQPDRKLSEVANPICTPVLERQNLVLMWCQMWRIFSCRECTVPRTKSLRGKKTCEPLPQQWPPLSCSKNVSQHTFKNWCTSCIIPYANNLEASPERTYSHEHCTELVLINITYIWNHINQYTPKTDQP